MLDAVMYDLIGRGESFERVEEWIEDRPVSDHQKSVLWMLALAEYPREQRRSVLVSTADHVAAKLDHEPLTRRIMSLLHDRSGDDQHHVQNVRESERPPASQRVTASEVSDEREGS